jgi:hypothetical protein
MLVEECAGPADGASPPAGPKLGNVMVVVPPWTETPGRAGAPLVPLPAPPGPGFGEMPPRALGSVPRPVPSLPAPDPSPCSPLPGPLPLPIPAPPPLPPSPLFAVPLGDMASAPPPVELGTPTFVPGWLETTTPEPAAFPPAFDGGATGEPKSSVPPAPAPLLPRPLPARVLPPPKPGGGGTTVASPKRVPADGPERLLPPEPFF